MSEPVTINGITWERHVCLDYREHLLLGSAPTNARLFDITGALSCLNSQPFWNVQPKHLKLSGLYSSFDVDRGCAIFEVSIIRSRRRQTLQVIDTAGGIAEFDQFDTIDFADWFPTLDQLPAELLQDFKEKNRLELVKQETWRDRPPLL